MNALIASQLLIVACSIYFIVVSVKKLPKAFRRFFYVVMALSFTATVVVAIYYPDELVNINEKLKSII